MRGSGSKDSTTRAFFEAFAIIGFACVAGRKACAASLPSCFLRRAFLLFGHRTFFGVFKSKLLVPVKTMPKSLRIPQSVADSFSREADGGKLQALKEQVSTFNSKFSGQMESVPAGQPRPAAPVRTQCRPAFGEGDSPVDTSKTILPSVALGIADFESAHEFLE